MKADAAVKLTSALNKNRGNITTIEFAQAKEAGLSDTEIIEIITHVGLNFLHNVLCNSMQAKIDFPEVQLLNDMREVA